VHLAVAGVRRLHKPTLGECDPLQHAAARVGLSGPRVTGGPPDMSATKDGRRHLRPDLVVRTIAELQAAGVEPDVWKIEGLEGRKDCERVVAQARAGGRDQVTCVVLGLVADLDRVAHWLRQAAPVAGYVGFAIGRTIWLDALSQYVAGRIRRDAAAVEQISANDRQMIGLDATAATETSPSWPARAELSP
jgi:myo-inositol catabolism protein IolC